MVRVSRFQSARLVADPGFEPLNERLFQLLAQHFGTVKVANQGEAMSGYSVHSTDGKLRWVVTHAGEYYRVSCPKCRDTRYRLWINHRFGTYEPGAEGKLNWLACCYRCHFEKDYEQRQDFCEALFRFRNRSERDRQFTIREGEHVEHQVLGPARLPGVVIPLRELSAGHPAVVYVRERGFDVTEASDEWGAGYCMEGYEPYEHCTHRLIIPVYFKSVLVGWQARKLGEGPGPKYFTMKHLAKSRMLYNYDRAVTSRVVVVVEGALDAWKVGLPAVALFGKSLAAGQKAVLQAGWPESRQGLLVVMLDPEADVEAEELMADTAELFPGRRVQVTLPEGEDPGSLTRDQIWDHIAAATAAAGLDLEDFLEEVDDGAESGDGCGVQPEGH